MIKDKRVLLVGAHPDDIEIGCGGTLSKYKGQAEEVQSVIFAPCLEDPLNKGILEEYTASMEFLGSSSMALRLPRDVLEDHIQVVRDCLHRFKVTYEPDVVFCPSVNDLHQDHRAVASACRTIFRDKSSILHYEVLRSTVHFNPNLYVELGAEDLENKLRLLNTYKSQMRRPYFSHKITEALAVSRGSQINSDLAEAFNAWRVILR